MEEWRGLPGLEWKYLISNTGRVLSKSRNGWKEIGTTQKNGYRTAGLYFNKWSDSVGIHRLVAITFIPNPDNLPCVNHKDENKENNCVENL